jgi:hypothetical protein
LCARPSLSDTLQHDRCTLEKLNGAHCLSSHSDCRQGIIHIPFAVRVTPTPAMRRTADPFGFGACVFPSILMLCGGYAFPYHSEAGALPRRHTAYALQIDRCISDRPAWRLGPAKLLQ